MAKTRLNSSVGMAVFAFLWGCLVVYGVWQGGFAAWFLAYVFGVLTAYGCAVKGFALRGLKVDRVLSNRAFFAGDDLEVTVSVHLNGWLPLPWLSVSDVWLKSEEGKPSGQRSFKHKKVFYPWFRTNLCFRYTMKAVKRGIYRFQAIEVRSGDVFGLLTCGRRNVLMQQFSVYPRGLLGKEVQVAQLIEGQDETGRSAFHGQSVLSVRDYMPGDAMNRIHWKTSARTRSLKTKTVDAMINREWIVVLDARREAYVQHAKATGHIEKDAEQQADEWFETAVRLACGYMAYADEQRLSAKLITTEKIGASNANTNTNTNANTNTNTNANANANANTSTGASYNTNSGVGTLVDGFDQLGTGLVLAQPGELRFVFEKCAVVQCNGTIRIEDALIKCTLGSAAGTIIVCVTPQVNNRLTAVMQQLQWRRLKPVVVSPAAVGRGGAADGHAKRKPNSL